MSAKEHQQSLNYCRVALMSSLFILFFGTTAVLVRESVTGIISALVVFVTGLLVAPLLASPIEWLVHRYVYHRSFGFLRRIYAIHLAHHHLYFPTWRYVTGGPARRIPIRGKVVNVPQISAWKNGGTYLAHFLFYMTLGASLIWLPMWLVSRSVPFVLGAIVGTTVISNLFIIVHDAIHRPGSHRMMERQVWFRFLDEHHYIHHVDTEANVNFLLPLADWLFGTLRRELTAEEIARHGSRRAAKSRLVGTGEPANEQITVRERLMAVATETVSGEISVNHGWKTSQRLAR